jgi:hypothetical protein
MLFGLMYIFLFIVFFIFKIRYVKTPYIFLFTLFFTWSAMSIIWSIDTQITVRNLIVLTVPLFALSISYRNISRQDIIFLVQCFYIISKYCIVLYFVSLIATYYLGMNDIIMRYLDLSNPGSTGFGSLNYPLSLFFIALFFVFQKELQHTIADYTVLFLVIFLLYGQLSRTYLLSAFIAFLLIIMFKYKRQISWLYLIIVCLLSYTTLAYLITNIEPLANKMFWNPYSVNFFDLLRNPLLLLDEHIVRTSGRFIKWDYFVTVLHIENNSFIGGGLGTVQGVLMSVSGLGGYYSHGLFAQYLAELGIIGFTLYCSFIVGTFIYYLKQYNTATDIYLKKLSLVIIVYLSGLVLASITYTPLAGAQANFILFSFFGIFHGYRKMIENE